MLAGERKKGEEQGEEKPQKGSKERSRVDGCGQKSAKRS
jgi:hypothetical protein